jgi:DNA-binding transcriptional LysR family regulator
MTRIAQCDEIVQFRDCTAFKNQNAHASAAGIRVHCSALWQATMSSPSAFEILMLLVFVALVERKRVTAAAEALGLAQSTVSEALSALERVLGTPLILRRRGGHGLELTDAGRALLPHARTILSAVDDAETAVAAATSPAHTNVEIVTSESVSSYLLPSILPPLRQRWPQTRFTVSVATCAGVREGVSGGAFDVGLLLVELATDGSAAHTSAPPASFIERRTVVPAIPLVLFACASHPLTSGRSSAVVRRDGLSAYPLFVSDGAGPFHDLTQRFFQGDGVEGPAIEAAGSIEGVKKAVINDARAIGLLPVYAVADELRAATLARVNLHPAPPTMRLDALLSRSRARHPATEELLIAVSR